MRTASRIVALGSALIAILFTLVLGITPAYAYTTAPLSTKSSLTSSTDVINFPDANLESVIRDTLDKTQGEITAGDLAGITVLNGENRGIADLSSIQYCVNLTVLDLRDNRINDISPLSKLIKLTTLWLKGNRITDITPLTNLTSLVDLTLRQNQITDISPLAGLTGLKLLYLSENQISDVSPISNLTRLTNLYLSNNLISDVSSLKTLVNLQERRLDGNPIQNLGSLSPLRQPPPASGQTTQTQDKDRVFWRIVWSIVAIVFVLGLAVRVFRGGWGGSEIVVCANGHKVSKKKFDELGECPTCGTDLYHRTGRHAE